MKWKSKQLAALAVVVDESFMVSSVEPLVPYFTTAWILSGCYVEPLVGG